MTGSHLNTPVRALLVMGLITIVLSVTSCVSVQQPLQETYYETVYITENRTETYDETVAVVKTICGEEALIPCVVWSNPSLRFKGHRFIWYYGYRLPGTGAHTEEKLRIALYKQDYYEYSLISLFDMAPRGQVLQPPLISAPDPLQPPAVQPNWITKEGDATGFKDWLNLANIKFNFARFLGGQSDLWMNRESAYAIEFDTRGARDIAIVIAAPTIPQNARYSASWIWTDNVTENITRTLERRVPYQVERKVEKQRTVYKTSRVPIWEAPFIK